MTIPIFNLFNYLLSKFHSVILRVTLALILVLVPKITKPQSVSTLMGARSASLANSSATLSDAWSLFNNVAGLATSRDATAAFAYSLSPSLPRADRAAALASIPFKSGSMGIGAFHFGDESYNEQIISGGYAHQLGLAALGFKVNYVQYSAEGFGTFSAISLHLGGIATITPKFLVGAYIENINQPSISDDKDEKLYPKLVTGIQFKPEETLLLLLEIEKDLHYQPTIKGGVEFELYKKIYIRTGVNLNPNSIHGGVGYQATRLRIDYAMQYNPAIRATYQISSSYQLTRSTQSK